MLMSLSNGLAQAKHICVPALVMHCCPDVNCPCHALLIKCKLLKSKLLIMRASTSGLTG